MSREKARVMPALHTPVHHCLVVDGGGFEYPPNHNTPLHPPHTLATFPIFSSDAAAFRQFVRF